MKSSLFWVISFLILTTSGGWTQVSHQPSVTHGTISADGDRYTFVRGNASMTIDTSRGGRIVGLSWKNDQILLQSAPNLPNFGSTFWTAPQSRWGWPPYHALHTAPYRATYSGDSLILTGPIGAESGYQAIKIIRLDSIGEAFDIRYTLINHADTVRSVGPWEVTAVPAGGLTFFSKAPTTEPLPQSTLSFADTLGISFFRYPPPDTTQIKQKLFAYSQDGWLAHVTDSRKLFIKKFESTPPDRVAPGQGEVEVFANTQYGYMELENHGPYRALAPGERTHYRVRWFLRELPNDIPADRVSQALIDLVEETIDQ